MNSREAAMLCSMLKHEGPIVPTDVLCAPVYTGQDRNLIDTLLHAPRGEPLVLERLPEPIQDVVLVTCNERDFEPAGVPLMNPWMKNA